MKLSRFIKVSIIGILSGLIVHFLLEHGFTKIITILSVIGMLSIIDTLFDIFVDYEQYEKLEENHEKIEEAIGDIKSSLTNMNSYLKKSREHIAMHESKKTECNQECWDKNTEVTNEDKQ